MSLDLEEPLDFHLPPGLDSYDPDVKLSEDIVLLHRQLICWCLVQRFWYYVIGEPQVSDQNYDEVEAEVKYLEDLDPNLSILNPYSPINILGSDLPTSYPTNILGMFAYSHRERVREMLLKQGRVTGLQDWKKHEYR